MHLCVPCWYRYHTICWRAECWNRYTATLMHMQDTLVHSVNKEAHLMNEYFQHLQWWSSRTILSWALMHQFIREISRSCQPALHVVMCYRTLGFIKFKMIKVQFNQAIFALLCSAWDLTCKPKPQRVVTKDLQQSCFLPSKSITNLFLFYHGS